VDRLGRAGLGLIAVAAVALGFAGCGGGLIGGPPATREPQEQTFGPTYPERPPSGRVVRVDRATLSPDGLVLTVEFIGGKGYLQSDGCSRDYVPWIQLNGGQLDLAVVELDRVAFGACTLEGYSYTFHLTLPARFEGDTVQDRGGGVLLVAAPEMAATVGKLPDGWSRQQSFAESPGPPPSWIQIFAPGPVDQQPEGPGRIVLHQVFGQSTEWTDTGALKWEGRGGSATKVTIHGKQTALWVDPDGEFLLAFDLDGNSLALLANRADVSAEELVEIAESVTIQ
jgi:hypothetical protein